MTIGTYLLPHLIKQTQNTFPGLTVKAFVNNSSNIEHQILENIVDVGLIENAPEHPHILSNEQEKECHPGGAGGI